MVEPSLILCYIIRNRINCGRSHELKLPPGYTLKKKQNRTKAPKIWPFLVKSSL